MKIDGSLARNIDFEVANLEVHKKTRRKTSVLKLESVKIGGSLARNARFDAPTCLVSSLWFSCGVAVSMGEAVKHLSFSKVSKQVVMLFCVASAALCDIPTCWVTCQKSFCVAGAILLRCFHKMSCSFRGRRSILEISVVILHDRCSTSDVSHCLLYTPHSTLYTPHFTLYTPRFTFHTLHSTLCTLHFTLHTVYSTLYTPHFRLYTSHFIEWASAQVPPTPLYLGGTVGRERERQRGRGRERDR